MGWATNHIEELKKGNKVQFRPRGNSMQGKIESGQLCTVEPAKDLNVNDIVLCKVKGSQFLHLITAISGERYQISNNKGHINGWIGRNCIFGKLVEIN